MPTHAPDNGRTALLRVEVLGELRVFRGDQPVDPGPRMQRALLTVLAVEASRVVSVDRLIDDLWGEQPPAAATATLQSYVSQLRRVLEPQRVARTPPSLLVTLDPGYVLRIDPTEVDLFRFQQLARAGGEALATGDLAAAEAALAASVALWRGGALEEFTGETWADRIGVPLRETLAVAIEDQVEVRLALGRHAAVVGEIEALVRAEPLRERRWAQLLVALYRSGRQADALRAYQRCRTALAEDLGIDPGPELRRLEQAILEQDAALDWSGPRPDGGQASLRESAERPSTGRATPHPASAGPQSTRTLLAREAHLSRISERVGGLAERGGAMVLVGEPGIGKTTLAEAAVALATGRGHRVVWARCVEDGTAPAYLPWTQLLRGLAPPGGRAACPAVAEALELLTGVRPVPDSQDAAQFLLYERVLAALEAVTDAGPVVAVIDDVHAADPPTLALLGLLAGDLHRLHLLVVVTARDTEPSLFADRVLGELVRNRGVERMFVTGLDPAQVGRFVENALDEPPSTDLITALYERTGGNPFYLAELVRLLVSEHRRELTGQDVAVLDVPDGVRDVLGLRIDRLPADTRSLLRLAALVGRDVDLEVLQSAAELDTEQLMLGLEPAVAAGLLVEDPRSWDYRFRHALVRDSIDAGLGRVERGRGHARVARAIEAVSTEASDDALSRLAHHYVLAGPLGDLAKAVEYCRRAAESTARRGAWSEAAELLGTASELVGSAEPDSGRMRCAVLLDLGRARRSAGDVRGSQDALSRVITLAGELGEDHMVAEAVALFGQVAPWGSRHYGEHDPAVIAVLEQQLDRLSGADKDDNRDPTMRARLLATLGLELYYTDRHAEGERFSRQAIELARQIGDTELLGQVLTNFWSAAHTPQRAAEAGAAVEETLTLAGRGLSTRTELTARIQHLGTLARRGDMAGYGAELAQCQVLAIDLHSPELDAVIGWADASRAILAARWEEAEALGARAAGLMRRTSAPGADWSVAAGQVAAGRARDDLREVADQLRALADIPEFRMFRPAVVLGDLHASRVQQARELAERWAAPPAPDWTWMLAIAHWAEVSTRIGTPDPQWLLDELAPFSGDIAIVGIALDCGGSVDALLAGLHRRLGHTDEAERLARTGLALERAAGLQAWIPRTTALLRELDAEGHG